MSIARRSATSALFVWLALVATACGADEGPPASSDASRLDGGATIADARVADEDGAPPDAPDGAAALDDGGGPASMPCTASGACDPFDVTSCGDGACRRGASGTECVPLDPATRAAGEPCERNDQCAPGTACLGFGDGFHCERMCPRGSVGHCGEGFVCTGTIGDACIQICRPLPPTCDIYTQECADPEHTCTLATDPEREVAYTGCRPAGPRTAGQTCGGDEGTCGHDLVCVRVAGVASCRCPCDPEAVADECPSGQACTGTAATWRIGFCADAAADD